MIAINLHGMAERVVHRAQRQGYVLPCEVREELAEAGLNEDLWKDVLTLARESLTCIHGRYYYSSLLGEQVLAEKESRLAVQAAVLELIGQEQVDTNREERREQGRVDFIQPVTVITEDRCELTMLSRDMSTTGIRLIGTQRLLGQKVRVIISPPGSPTLDFLVRVLWTCPIGDELVENGGMFLSVARMDG